MWSEHRRRSILSLDQFSEISVDRVVDGYPLGHTHVVPESTLREMIMRAMCDSPLVGNSEVLT
jgi:hypothetical protein